MGHDGLVHLIFIAVFLSLMQHSNTELCISNSSSSSDQGPNFTSPYVYLDYVRINHEIEIACCGINYDSIDWYKFNDYNWEKFIPCKGRCPDSKPASDEGGQVLRIKSIDSSSNTSFQCVLNKKGYSSVNRTTQIFVVRCDELARGPIATIHPFDQDIFSFGEDVTFQCEGYFGCDEFKEKFIGWFIQDSVNSSQIQSNGTKLTIQNYSKNDETIMGINLTVHSVEPQDIGRIYVCVMADPQITEQRTIFRVQINKKEPPIDKWKLIGICVGVALGSVILISLIIWIVWYCYGPQIKLRIRQALPDGFIGPKTLDDEKYEYNAILYHAEEDTQKAEQIKKDLEKHGWKIKISADILGGARILTESFMYCEKSALVMFLYTDNLRNDRMANLIFEAIIEVKKNKKILVIEINNKLKKTFMKRFKAAKDIKKVQEQNNEVKNVQPEENLGLLQTDFWKGVSTIKWNTKHENKVLCQIQNKLPKLKFQVQMEKRMNLERKAAHNLSVGSQKPLLSQNRGSSTIVECSPPPMRSPGSDCVFFGEEEEVNSPVQNPENVTKYAGRVNEDLLAEVHVDGHPKISTAADTDDISHITHHEGDLANQDLHDSQNSVENQPGQNPTASAEYRAGAYGESPATSGYGSLEASGSKSLENSSKHNHENYKEDLGQQLRSNRQQSSDEQSSRENRLPLSQSSDEQSSRENRLPLSQSSDENSSRGSKYLLTQSSHESGYASSLSCNPQSTEFDSIKLFPV
ncbi:hypothetical protein CHS0354_023388 [Potamilus streckersoni]|uniref:Uncharacterized protein n=1 Tax=Potamilus streckersoni TaxID=2493646 RepID=A0AAE0T5J9_9BIVA|nr:hypothetical protein CHS0354_023388 [Potamilus streckersoni]